MKRFAFSFVLLGIAAVSALSQGDRSSRTRVATTPTPQAPSIQNDTVRPQGERRAPVFSTPNGGRPAATPTPGSNQAISGDSDEEIRVETNLVTMPVSVLDRDGRFVSGLAQRDFEIFENGAKQKIEHFQSVEQPFTVVLMIDVSPSTQFRIDEIQTAAITFVDQLRPADRVMVIAFDERVRVLSEPTNNRGQLRNAIYMAEFGDGTSLYEAVDNALNRQLAKIQGRKAIVIFTDGVDTTSRRANYQSTILDVEEADALVYPIRYNTQRGGFGGGGGGGGGWGGPRQRRRSTGWGGAIGIILGGQLPPVYGGGGPAGGSSEEYETGRQYLEELAAKSGGRKFEADSSTSLDTAFAGIAEELRRQYSVGYYPDTAGQKGERRQIKVRVMRPGLVVRAKNSYVVGETDNRRTGT
ncbi:MAG: VWA domain-containing protein [bacterium]|nr:VWA domain-containing protein [bacterium]